MGNNMSVRNELLQQVLTAYGGTFTGRESRNELLKLIALQIDSSADLPNTRNEILETILELVGGTASDDNRNALMNAIVSTLGGVEATNRNDIVKAWIEVAGSVDSRWYMKFNGSSFARLNDTITLDGAFSIRVQTYMLNGGISSAQLLGMSGDANVSLQVSSDGSMQVRTVTTSRITASAGTFVFGQQNEVYVERFDDGSATLQVNGVEVGVSPSFGGDMVVDLLGRYASGSGGFTIGYVWDYELNGGAAGDVVIPLDEPFTEDHLIYDSNGNEIGIKSNDLEEDYTQTEPV